VAIRKSSKHKDYARYAALCLEMSGVVTGVKARALQREMAAEWLKLADAILHPPRSAT
jgi:hypothetical protein